MFVCVRDRYRVGVCERESKSVGKSEWVSVRKRKIVFVSVFKSVCEREREYVAESIWWTASPEAPINLKRISISFLLTSLPLSVTQREC